MFDCPSIDLNSYQALVHCVDFGFTRGLACCQLALQVGESLITPRRALPQTRAPAKDRIMGLSSLILAVCDLRQHAVALISYGAQPR